ncbi:MAG: penicillin acylase family protein [Chryseolinea sp.]
MTWDEISTSDVLLERPTTYTTLRLLRTQPTLPFFDIISTPAKEQAQDIIRKSFILAIDAVNTWTKEHPNVKLSWSNFKDTHVNHLLRIGPLSESVSGGGSADAINALSRSHGPSWRMVVSMEQTGIRMWATYPGGQSGNPGSVYYNNLIPSWELGHHNELLMMKSARDAKDNNLYTLLINEE